MQQSTYTVSSSALLYTLNRFNRGGRESTSLCWYHLFSHVITRLKLDKTHHSTMCKELIHIRLVHRLGRVMRSTPKKVNYSLSAAFFSLPFRPTPHHTSPSLPNGNHLRMTKACPSAPWIVSRRKGWQNSKKNPQKQNRPVDLIGSM